MPYDMTTYAVMVERDAEACERRAKQMRALAERLRTTPSSPIAPTGEMREHLAKLGFAVISVDALVVAEACMQMVEPEDDGLAAQTDGELGASEWAASLKAVREAMRACHKLPRLLRNSVSA